MRIGAPREGRRVVVSGVAAMSAYGATWRGLGAALRDSTRLAGLPPETPLANPKARNARKMMSRGAYLAAATLADLMRDVGWTAEQRELAGYFLGVGASGGSLDDVTALLDASIVFDPARDNAPGMDPYGFSLPAFGSSGLAACNPLLAFQLMNNFTLAHGAIFEGLGGPNGALFSRGAGTTAALVEAVHTIAAGDCDHAVAGGADSATHPVTVAELAREGFLDRGLAPAEGAALLALSVDRTLSSDERTLSSDERTDSSEAPTAPLDLHIVVIDGCAIASGRGRSVAATLDDVVARAAGPLSNLATTLAGRADLAGVPTPTGAPVPLPVVRLEDHARDQLRDPAREPGVVVLAAWGPPAADAASTWVRARFPSAEIVDTAPLGATLAAGPALGWAVAIDLVASGAFERALVIDLGVDGDAGAVLFHDSTAGAVQSRELLLRGAA